MNPIFQYIITETLKRQLSGKGQTLSSGQFAKELKNSKTEPGHVMRNSFMILAGISHGA